MIASGCTNLQQGGAYAPGEFTIAADGTTNFNASASPDIAFYYADATYNSAYSIVDAAFKWEAGNRAALFKLDPDIKHALDSIRPTAWDIQKRWAVARSSYVLNPVPANLTTIQTIVDEIQRIVPAVTAAEALVSTNNIH